MSNPARHLAETELRLLIDQVISRASNHNSGGIRDFYLPSDRPRTATLPSLPPAHPSSSSRPVGAVAHTHPITTAVSSSSSSSSSFARQTHGATAAALQSGDNQNTSNSSHLVSRGANVVIDNLADGVRDALQLSNPKHRSIFEHSIRRSSNSAPPGSTLINHQSPLGGEAAAAAAAAGTSDSRKRPPSSSSSSSHLPGTNNKNNNNNNNIHPPTPAAGCFPDHAGRPQTAQSRRTTATSFSPVPSSTGGGPSHRPGTTRSERHLENDQVLEPSSTGEVNVFVLDHGQLHGDDSDAATTLDHGDRTPPLCFGHGGAYVSDDKDGVDHLRSSSCASRHHHRHHHHHHDARGVSQGRPWTSRPSTAASHASSSGATCSGGENLRDAAMSLLTSGRVSFLALLEDPEAGTDLRALLHIEKEGLRQDIEWLTSCLNDAMDEEDEVARSGAMPSVQDMHEYSNALREALITADRRDLLDGKITAAKAVGVNHPNTGNTPQQLPPPLRPPSAGRRIGTPTAGRGGGGGGGGGGGAGASLGSSLLRAPAGPSRLETPHLVGEEGDYCPQGYAGLDGVLQRPSSSRLSSRLRSVIDAARDDD